MDMSKTMYFQPKAATQASLLILDKRNQPILVPLKGNCTLGRQYDEASCDILLHSPIVGRRQGEFVYDDSDGSYYYIDNNSTNGTYINGEKLQPYNERGSKAFKLTDGDILRVDRRTLNDPHPDAVLMIFSKSFTLNEQWSEYNFSSKSEISIGRGEENNLRLDNLMVSQKHAVLSISANGLTLRDNDSTNGVSVNGKEIETATVYDHDVIKIANTTLIILGRKLLYNDVPQKEAEEKGLLNVDIIRKTVQFGKKTLLKDIHFEIENNDFVLILGGSGAGKTTLVRAILGDSKAEGKITLDGQDLYVNFKKMKSQIGLVPQFLTLRLNDTVRNSITDAAKVKLGREYSNKEINARVDEVLEKVGITKLQDHLISQLSGGQKKKVSVAVQLVGFQKVFICDEPDSGLDAASRIQQMELLKEISLSGKIVMVITHEPDDAFDLFTKVVVLAKSSEDNAGHLAYFGDVKGATEYFGVKRLQDIMLEINPPYEGGRGHADMYIEKYKSLKGGQALE